MKRVKTNGQSDIRADSSAPKTPSRPKAKKLTATMKRRALKIQKSERLPPSPS